MSCIVKDRILFIVFCIILLSAQTMAGATEKPLKKKMIKKENKSMTVSFTQPYANIHRNSLVLEKTEAKGKDVKRIQITGRNSMPESTDFFLYDSRRGVLCTHTRVYIVSLEDGTTGEYKSKLIYSPLVCDGKDIYITDMMLMRRKPETISEHDPAYDVAGYPGGSNSLSILFPFSDYFISGVIARPAAGAPRNIPKEFILGCGLYAENENEVWSITVEEPLPPPPVCNREGNIVFYHLGKLMLIKAKNGKKLIEKPVDKEILLYSVGPDGRLYTVASKETEHYFVEWDEKFNEVWETEILRLRWTQPPVTMNNGTVLLVTNGMIIAIRDGKELWKYASVNGVDETFQQQIERLRQYAFDYSEDIEFYKRKFKATATANNRIVLIDGNRLVCLDENGKELWVYTKNGATSFRTQLVIGKDGEIYVADNEAIYVVR